MAYGVTPAGFVRKRLPEILGELEAAMVAAFGPGVVQTAQSPLGQLNGLVADLSSKVWEVGEDAYQSFDVDQAEGPRLDMLAKLRRLARPDGGEADPDFRLRISNQGQTDISTTRVLARLLALDGVSWSSVRINAGDSANALGVPPHSVAYAVVGGDDVEVGTVVYQETVGGITLHGNTEVEIVADGFCQLVRFIRPVDVPITVEIDVRRLPDSCNCAPPSVGTIAATVAAAFATSCGYRNGDTVTAKRVRAEAARVQGIEVDAVRIARGPALTVEEEVHTTLFERPLILLPNIAVRYVD
ncbi:hypothetical protein ABEG18_12980 [Alsobacter sp. KACC 23698]|uniref:Baseplate protein J-like domain-containing protein n=1 Tax=Alsobacter sp. KACC 23698 TaxID=3149229 RepID=A0AAU7JN08_9HYPH